MLSAAGLTVEERIARAFWEARELTGHDLYPLNGRIWKDWDEAPSLIRELLMRAIGELLAEDVIRPGGRA